MGYYTDYKIEIKTEDGKPYNALGDMISELEKISGYSFEYDDSITSEDSIKWYSYRKNMQMLSKQYPNLLFEVYGIGEDSLDYWVEYHQDGKYQYCNAEIIYPKFDINKLEK